MPTPLINQSLYFSSQVNASTHDFLLKGNNSLNIILMWINVLFTQKILKDNFYRLLVYMRYEMKKRNGRLNGVMYALFHLRNLEDARANKYMYNIYDLFTKEFDQSLQIETISAIELALESGDINQFCTLPGIPGTDEFKIEYLEIVLSHLKNAIA